MVLVTHFSLIYIWMWPGVGSGQLDRTFQKLYLNRQYKNIPFVYFLSLPHYFILLVQNIPFWTSNSHTKVELEGTRTHDSPLLGMIGYHTCLDHRCKSSREAGILFKPFICGDQLSLAVKFNPNTVSLNTEGCSFLSKNPNKIKIKAF